MIDTRMNLQCVQALGRLAAEATHEGHARVQVEVTDVSLQTVRARECLATHLTFPQS